MKLIGQKDLLAKGVSYSRTHLWRLIRNGKFPKPVKVGENRIAFVESEIDEWIGAKIAERDRAAA